MPDALLADRIAGLDWPSLQRSLDEHGFAKLPALLKQAECERIAEAYPDGVLYRSRRYVPVPLRPGRVQVL